VGGWLVVGRVEGVWGVVGVFFFFFVLLLTSEMVGISQTKVFLFLLLFLINGLYLRGRGKVCFFSCYEIR